MKLNARLLLLGAVVLLAPLSFAQTEGEVMEDAVEEVQAETVDDLGEGELLDEAVEGSVDESPVVEQPVPVAPRARPTRPVPAPRPTAGVASPRPVRPRPAAPRPSSPLQPATVSAGASAASAPVDPDALNGDSIDAPVTFDFDRSPLIEVIKSLALTTGRNFQVDPNIAQAEVTVITHDKIPPEMAYDVMESILATYGFSMVETLDGNLVKIIQTNQATVIEKLPLYAGLEEIPEGFDGYSMHIVDVKYADPTELESALQVVASPNAQISIYLPTGTLIITDTADGLRRIRRLIERVDVPGYDTTMEIFTLEYTRAELISTQITEVLLDTEGGQTRRTNTQARPQPVRAGNTRTARPTVPGQGASQVIGSDEDTLRMVPDERLNALIVVASEGMMERVRDLVDKLDTPTPYEKNTLHLYELLNADAELVEQALQPLVSTSPRRGGGGGGNAGGGGGGATEEVQPFERQVEIARYDQTNSLLIVASPQDYQVLEAFIARLDLPQRQVHVDAVVMDVTIADNYTVAVEAAGITGSDGFGVTNTSRLSGLAASLTPVADAAGEIVGGPQAALLGGVLGLGAGGGLTTGIFDDIEVEVNGVKVSVPFVPLLFQAIETVSQLEVLSQPSLMTVDNEEASISVGQEVPFVTSQRRNTGTDSTTTNNQFSFNNFNSITREDVGVQLTVTPQISEGDNVLLELELEVSDLDAEQIGDVNLLGPTTNKSLIQNKVLVKDGSTAVLAGFIRDITNRRRNQTPIAGDLPVIGWLFRGKTNSRNKRNMVVLVTPHIVKDAIDHERVTDNMVREYHDANIDELLNQNFFKKIRKKVDRRKNYRPTFDKSEELTGVRADDGFGRGDLRR